MRTTGRDVRSHGRLGQRASVDTDVGGVGTGVGVEDDELAQNLERGRLLSAFAVMWLCAV